MPHEEKPHIVIVSGDDYEAERGGLWFSAMLLSRFGLPAELIRASQLTARQLRRQLKEVFQSGSEQPLVVVYNGHGGGNGWGPWEDRRERVEYRVLANLADRYRGPVLFINCACFAIEMANEFEKRKVPQDRVGVIAACEGSWMSVATLLLRQVLESWQKRLPYTPGYMGEVYFIPVAKHPGGRAHIFLERGRMRGVWQRFSRIVFRPTLGLLSLLWPLEHSTYFSRRWGAVHDDLVIAHLQESRVPTLVDELLAEFMCMLHRDFKLVFRVLFPTIDSFLWKFMPPRP